MSRSIKKGPFVDQRLLKKLSNIRIDEKRVVVNTWSRACVITPEMVGYTIGVHNGKTHIPVLVVEQMVGHRLGEFSPTRKFTRHGGKMQKEQEQKAAESSSAAVKAVQQPAKKPVKK